MNNQSHPRREFLLHTGAGLLVLSTANLMADGVPTAGVAARKPTYPVFGMLQTDPQKGGNLSLNTPEAFAPLAQYELIYTTEGPALKAVRDARKFAGCQTPVIVYMGGFTTNPGGATEIEQGFRRAVAMVDVTTLASALAASSTEVRVRMPQDGELAIKASTVDLTDPNNKSKYCFWIRIDDELMKVTEADAKSGVLRVQRGFESKATTHAEGATVLAPVYLGNRKDPHPFRHTNSWPGGPDYLRYALDPATAAAQKYKAGLIAALVNSGYDGAWLDTFQPIPYNLCDAVGRKVQYFWDFATRRRYDLATYLAALQQFLQAVHQQVKAATGKRAVLAGNSVSNSYTLGSRQLFATAEHPDLLNGGYCFEDSYITPKGAKGKQGKLETGFSPTKMEHWLRNVENQADAARSGLRALCMIGPAGYVAAHINPALPNYDQLIRFGWGSFLLTVTKERTTWFGLPLLVTKRNGKAGFLPLPEMFFASLGDPTDGNEIQKLKWPNGVCYQRKFANGMVLVNPSESPAEVEVPAGYTDCESKQTISRISLPSGDARLLIKA